MLPRIRYAIRIAEIAGKRFFNESYTYRASALAFTTLLALVPLLSVLVFIVSIFPVFSRLVTLTQNYVFANFLPTSTQIVQQYLEGFVSKASHLPIIGVFFLFVVAIMLIVTIENTLNEIWQVQRRKKHMLSWLFYALILCIAPIFIGISIFASSYIFSLVLFAHVGFFSLHVVLLSLFPLLMNTVLFSLVYTVMPCCRVNWRDGFVGGFVAAVLFEIAKKLFAVYIYYFSTYELIYGVLATIPIFLLWLYLSWMIVLYGALISHTRYLSRRKKIN